MVKVWGLSQAALCHSHPQLGSVLLMGTQALHSLMEMELRSTKGTLGNDRK